MEQKEEDQKVPEAKANKEEEQEQPVEQKEMPKQEETKGKVAKQKKLQKRRADRKERSKPAVPASSIATKETPTPDVDIKAPEAAPPPAYAGIDIDQLKPEIPDEATLKCKIDLCTSDATYPDFRERRQKYLAAREQYQKHPT